MNVIVIECCLIEVYYLFSSAIHSHSVDLCLIDYLLCVKV